MCIKKDVNQSKLISGEDSLKIIKHIENEAFEEGGFFFNDTATTEIYTLALHDALPI